ncbi:putative bifunctional diguanylate cyclase/phosphodiesterase [Pleionea sediminis]|uniref:putative bifunctional diguanylate cyclase/phosphodiesterase n=1 Tax=Pleionea sediminis TaxID=2569479 RepID=UPI0011864C4A|nr:EAL domain-containing protein [Pleionea sediminis]
MPTRILEMDDDIKLTAFCVALNAVSDCVIITDTDGVIHFSNDCAKSLLAVNDSSHQNLTDSLKFIQQSDTRFRSVSIEELCQDQALMELQQTCFLSGKDGRVIPFKISAQFVSAKLNGGKSQYCIFTIVDESKTNQLKETIDFQKKYDQLTGLVNRSEFERVLMETLQDAKLNKATHSMFLIKLSQTKLINEAAGYLAGNELIKSFAEKLSDNTRSNDLLARIGNDEFCLLLWRVDIELAEKIAVKLLANLERFSFTWNKKEYLAGSVIGVTKIDSTVESWVQAIQHAEMACSQAKVTGPNQYCIYSPSAIELKSHQEEVQWVSKLVYAVRNDWFEFYQQPIISLKGERDLNHCEVLLRVRDEHNKASSPAAFLIAAEKYNMINMIDRWVVLNSFRWLSEHRGIFLDHINVNLSGISLTQPEFLTYIDDLMTRFLVPPEKLCFEITETAAVENLMKAREFIDTIKSFGCRIALDDFGTGMASFSYLKNLPVDFVKIDGEFVREITEDRVSVAMVRSINDVAHEIGALTIAEYVENNAIKEQLIDLGVDFAQGYGIGLPEPIDSLVEKEHSYPYSSSR